MKALLLFAIAAVPLFFIPMAFADVDILVTQENLTDAEQKTLDDIAQAKADGTYMPPFERIESDDIQFTANIEVIPKTLVEVELHHSVSETSCEFQDSAFAPRTICVFTGFAPDGSAPAWDMEKQEWTSEIILEQEAKEIYVQQQQQTIEDGKELTLNEWRIQYIEAKNNPSDIELEELELRAKLGALCKNDTLVSQKYREFEVPTIIFKDHEGKFTEKLVVDTNPKSNEYRKNSYVKDLKMQVQECIGQQYTKKSVQYDHIVVDGLYTADPNKPQAPDAITADMVNEDANTGFVSEGVSAVMCSSHNSERTKQMYGCPAPTPDASTGEIPEMKEFADSPAYQKWMQYLEDPDSLLEEAIENRNLDYRATVYGGGQK